MEFLCLFGSCLMLLLLRVTAEEYRICRMNSTYTISYLSELKEGFYRIIRKEERKRGAAAARRRCRLFRTTRECVLLTLGLRLFLFPSQSSSFLAPATTHSVSSFSPPPLRAIIKATHQQQKTTMSDQSQTAAKVPPAEPVLCKMGCGFFGNGTTGGCCSKCWQGLQKKKEPTDDGMAAPAVSEVKTMPMETEELIIESTSSQKQASPVVEEAPEEPAKIPTKKGKKKKLSYKNMMAGMMHTSADSGKAEKEKDALRKVTGGGAFSKVDKI